MRATRQNFIFYLLIVVAMIGWGASWVHVKVRSACSGCASASTGILFAIEGILKQKLDPNIRVLPL